MNDEQEEYYFCENCKSSILKTNKTIHDAMCQIFFKRENININDNQPNIKLDLTNNIKDAINNPPIPMPLPVPRKMEGKKESANKSSSSFICPKCKKKIDKAEKEDHMLCHQLQDNDKKVLKEHDKLMKKYAQKIPNKRTDANRNNTHNILELNNVENLNAPQVLRNLPRNAIINNNNLIQNRTVNNTRALTIPIRINTTGTRQNNNNITTNARININNNNNNVLTNLRNPPVNAIHMPRNNRRINPIGYGLERIYMNNLTFTNDRKNNKEKTEDKIINMLPKIKIEDPEKLDEDKKSCPICLDDFKAGKEVMSLPCMHFYHEGCIKKWLKNNNKCPMCKFLLTEKNINKI